MSSRKNKKTSAAKKAAPTNGNTVEKSNGKPTDTIGSPGTPMYGGWVAEYEQSPDIAGTSKYRTFSDILSNVSIVAAGVRYFVNLHSAPSFTVVPANDSPEAKDYADKVDMMLKDMNTSLTRVARRAAMYRFYGFSVQEITAKRREDGSFGIKDIAPRAQRTIERWDRDEESGDITACYQRNPQNNNEVRLPREKLLYMVDDTLNDSPEGLGLFRHIVEPARKLRRYEQLEGFGYESDLRGIPIARVPLEELNELEPYERSQMIAATNQFMKNHTKANNLGLMVDSATYAAQDESARPTNVRKWDIELLRSSSNGQGEVIRTIERITRDIARVLGVEQILLGDHSGGSFALAAEKSHAFTVMIDTSIKEFAEAMHNDVFRYVFDINGWPLEMRPRLIADKLKTRRIEEVTNSLKDMAQSGAVLSPNDPAINAVRDLLGLPEADTVDEMDALPEVPEETKKMIEEALSPMEETDDAQ